MVVLLKLFCDECKFVYKTRIIAHKNLQNAACSRMMFAGEELYSACCTMHPHWLKTVWIESMVYSLGCPRLEVNTLDSDCIPEVIVWPEQLQRGRDRKLDCLVQTRPNTIRKDFVNEF